jgi:hypothetical protein
MYDARRGEHVIYLEYRVRVKPGGMNVPNPGTLPSIGLAGWNRGLPFHRPLINLPDNDTGLGRS